MSNWAHRIRHFGPALIVGAVLLTTGGAPYAANPDSDLMSTSDPSGSIVVDDSREQDVPSMAKVALQDAIQIALAQAPGQVVEVELEKEDGYWVYEVEIIESTGAKTEITVDAENGAVLEIEPEDDDG